MKVEITSSAISQIEGQQALITFSLSSPAPADFNLNYKTRIDGDKGTVDATAGADYTADRVVKVQEGDRTGSISIPITDDTEIDEGMHEVFVVELTGPMNGSPYWIGPANITSTVTINDGICDRAQIVQDAISVKLSGDPSCHDVTKSDLNGIVGTLRLKSTNEAVSLKAGEFRELTSVDLLTMSVVNLSKGLPLRLFEGLDSVERLSMCFTQLSSLQAGVFAGLGKITQLWMDNNSMSNLPAGLFEDIPTLKEVRLYSNKLKSLDSDAFRGAVALETVELQDNKLATLPSGLFHGLENLTTLKLHGNREGGFTLTAHPKDNSDGSFVISIAEGVPFGVTVSFQVTGGTVVGNSVTIPAGSSDSPSVGVTWDSGNTGTVTVVSSTPRWSVDPKLSGPVTGINLAAGADLVMSKPADD